MNQSIKGNEEGRKKTKPTAPPTKKSTAFQNSSNTNQWQKNPIFFLNNIPIFETEQTQMTTLLQDPTRDERNKKKPIIYSFGTIKLEHNPTN